MTRADRLIDYEAGNERAPTPVGRTALRIDAARASTFEHRRAGTPRRWRGRIVGPVRERFFAALAQSKFPPQEAWPPPPAKETLRYLTLEGEPRERIMIPWHVAMKQPGSAEAFQLLDQTIGQLSGDDVRVVKDAAETLVLDAERLPSG